MRSEQVEAANGFRMTMDLKLPILRVGVGESIEDLQQFNAMDFARALVGA